jgi:hypothetical protein
VRFGKYGTRPVRVVQVFPVLVPLALLVKYAEIISDVSRVVVRGTRSPPYLRPDDRFRRSILYSYRIVRVVQVLPVLVPVALLVRRANF